jgi:HEPN domain
MVTAASEETPTSAEDAAGTKVGLSLFESMTVNWVKPEVLARREDGSWTDEDLVYRFQVQFLDNDEVAVRLNGEVQGVLEAKATRAIEKGEEVFEDDFSEISGYRLPEEYAYHPHVTGFCFKGEWFLAFQLGHRDPARFEVLAAGKEFLATAHEALAAGRLRAFFDVANSAVELLAKAELLSCGPTIEYALKSVSHRTLSSAYNIWTGRLGNSERRFADALNRLAKLRRQARYIDNELEGDEAEAAELLATLDEMERHVSHLAEAPMEELKDGFTVLATRELKAGELLGADEMTIFPAKQPKKSKASAD